MSKFNKASLLAALLPKTAPIDVEGFGSVGIIQLTVAEVLAMRAGLAKEGKSDEFGLRMVLASVVDESSARVFDEADLPGLQASSNAAMEGLIAKALEVNGFKKVVEVKN